MRMKQTAWREQLNAGHGTFPRRCMTASDDSPGPCRRHLIPVAAQGGAEQQLAEGHSLECAVLSFFPQQEPSKNMSLSHSHSNSMRCFFQIATIQPHIFIRTFANCHDTIECILAGLCVATHTHTRIHTHIYTYTHTYIPTIPTHTHTHVHIHTHTHIQTHTHTYTHTFLSRHLLHAQLNSITYACIHIHTYRVFRDTYTQEGRKDECNRNGNDRHLRSSTAQRIAVRSQGRGRTKQANLTVPA